MSACKYRAVRVTAGSAEKDRARSWENFRVDKSDAEWYSNTGSATVKLDTEGALMKPNSFVLVEQE